MCASLWMEIMLGVYVQNVHASCSCFVLSSCVGRQRERWCCTYLFAARWTLDPDVDPHYSAAVRVKGR